MSNFVVSARKYRPTTFDEVIGQNHVAKTLKNALQHDKLAHAFLFCGPRGVGKTTCARILAKVINCENPVNQVEPCNTCSSCKSFNDNASFNIIELDAASNNSVEHIRTLIEQVRFQPQHGTHKVFIIDEVHMLSTQAFNAFLKTLEEPPPYAIFILATTEKHKIIPTILSRCQIFDFKRIQVEDVVRQLQHICKEEGRNAEIEALHLIGQKADGAMRDALSIYDKIASATEGDITYKDVISNLNILDYEYYFKVVDAFLQEDLSEVLLIMDEVIRDGFDPDQFIHGLSNHFRDLLVCKDSRTLSLLEVSDSLKKRYQEQAVNTSKSILLTGLDILNQCDVTLPRSKNKRLYTEIALSKINFASRAIEANLTGDGEGIKKKTEPSNVVPPKPNIPKPEPTKHKVPPVEEKAVIDLDKKDDDVSADSEKATEPSLAPPPPSENKENKLESQKEKVKVLPVKKLNNVEALMAKVEAEEKSLMEARQGLNQENLQALWNKYAENHNSPSAQTALLRVIITLDKETINVTVPSDHYSNMILQEDALKEMLRKEMGAPELIINTIVDKEQFPDIEIEKPKVLMSSKEKYVFMAEKNPGLTKLVNTLGLKPETGGSF